MQHSEMLEIALSWTDSAPEKELRKKDVYSRPQKELRKKKDDYEELREQMKRQVENSTCFQRDLAEREEAVSQTNKKFDEDIENLQLVRFFQPCFFVLHCKCFAVKVTLGHPAIIPTKYN